MRLLHFFSGELGFTNFDDEAIPPSYAILSHTWVEGNEVTFHDLIHGTGKDKSGYQKIRFCGEQARQDGLQYFWVDTCCIDKTSSAELSEAINSMYEWYHNSTRCYVYLSDVSTVGQNVSDQSSELYWKPAFQHCRWFTRGWTLQELLAPISVEFFSKEGVRLGSKFSLVQQIHEITGIPISALQGVPLSQFSVDERLRWIQNRQTAEPEDRAYSLLGIFNVYIPPIYGEGETRAFQRLRDEINRVEICVRDLRITDPRNDKQRIEGTQNGSGKGSYRWILENSTFQNWRGNRQSQLLWIKGDPGRGKTTLLCGIINELDKSMDKTAILSYFFCQATDARMNNATAVLRGLIYLLVDQQPSLVSHVRKRHDHTGKALFNDANAWVALSEIFINILHDSSLNRTFLIIDALDECVVGLPKLLDFIHKSRVSSRVKWLVSSRNETNIEWGLQLEDLGAKLSLEPEDDDADIQSFVDSGYGTTSETSSVYFIANAPEAREDILALILQDEELQVLFRSAFEKISAPKFENSFRIMLGQFARELRNEARDKRERSVAYAVRTIAGYVSNHICKKYSPETDMRTKEMDQLARQLPHKRQMLERLLNPAFTDSQDLHTIEPSTEYQGFDAEEDNWDENDVVPLPHLEQLERFVVNSEAMNNLRKNLHNWIEPQHGRSQPLGWDEVTAKEPPEMHEPDDQEQTVTYQMSNTNQDQQPWWRLINTLKRFARPSLQLGYRRLEWTCDCGEEMYGDYDNRNPAALEKLASILHRRASVTRAIGKDNVVFETNREEDMPENNNILEDSDGGEGEGSQASTSNQAGPQAVASDQAGLQAPASNQAGPTGTDDSSSNVQSSSEATSQAASSHPPRKRKFLELCVNTGEIDISLGEIDVTDVNTDGELFKKIYERYKNLRGHRMRRIFLKPTDVHFVRFSVQDRYRVGVYEKPLVIPPEDEVKAERYHYEECPLIVQPPMDHRSFFHYMNKHKHGDLTNSAGMLLHSDATFLNRLPKKVGASILGGQQSSLQFGWGVHIIEGPNKVALSWTTFAGLALSFAVSLLYCHFWHTQEQGFAIGQWMVAVLGAAMAALYFQWEGT